MPKKGTNGSTVATNADRNPRDGWMSPSVVDPKAGVVSGRNVLVVSTVDDVVSSLRAHVRSDDVVKVIVPVVGQGLIDWLANDEKAFSHAQDVAETAAEQLPGEPVAARAGEADVGLAIRDALATFPADEILVALETYDATVAASIGVDDATGAGGLTIAGVPVRIVTIAAA